MPPQRPIFLYIVAGVGIALAVIGLLWKPLSVVGLLAGSKPIEIPYFHAEIPQSVLYMSAVSSVIGWLYAWALLAGAIGTYFGKAWARPTMNIYAVISIVVNVAWVILYLIGIMPIMQSVMGNTGPQPPPPGLIYVSMVIAGFCYLPFLITYQIVVLVAYNTKTAKDYFAGRFPAPAPMQAYAGVEYAQPAPYYPDPSQQQGYYPPQAYYPPPQPQYPYQYPPQQGQPPYPGYGPPPPPAYPTDQNPPPPPETKP